MVEEKLELRCSNCSSKQIYTLKDKTIVCRKCGFREEPKKRGEINNGG
ncbi:MAG: hypothetical protein ACE5ES_03530 [Candidatus Nanoarchaeia archaeon]